MQTMVLSCVDTINHHLVFPAGALKAFILQTHASRVFTSCENLMMYSGLYQHRWFCILITLTEVPTWKGQK